ncbi:MbnP family protein [Sphingobacterium sp.]|uniref:MbnP family protein n=1 Tax=Sphingobacterium sp. TaxID=341027 RepID=UPI0025E32E1B|nr:MbnP family protein [Sphingobacterium sp.]
MLKQPFKSFLIFTPLLSLFSCSKEKEIIINNSSLELTFDNRVGNEDFNINKTYNIDGKNYTFDSFRYWISNIKLETQDGSWYEIPNAYYLIEETGEVTVQDGQYVYPANKRETIVLNNIPKNTYKSISFAVGVDEKRNNNLSDAIGELSTMKGMTNVSWMWHTSYIFSSIKGMVVDKTSKVLKIETGLNENYRTITVKKDINLTQEDKEIIKFEGDVVTILQAVDSWNNPAVAASTPKLMEIVADAFKNNFFKLK